MKVWGIANGPAARGTKIKDAFLTVRQKDGSLVVRSWPRKRGHYQSQRQREWGEWFGAVSRWATQPDPGSQLYALQVVVGTIFMPRDVLIKLAAGKLWDVQLADGTQLWNIWLMADQIQVMLDTISDEIGVILTRSQAGWIAIEPGTPGYVLTQEPGGAVPAWREVSATGVTSLWTGSPQSTNSTSQYNTQGAQFQCPVDLTIDQVFSKQTEVAGEQYKFVLYATDNYVITDILGETEVFTADASITRTRYLSLIEPATVPANTLAVIALTRLNPAPLQGSFVWVGSYPYQGFPSAVTPNYCHINAPDPQPGDRFDVGGSYRTINFRFRF